MSIEVVTGPAIEPVSLSEVRDYCRVPDDDDNDFLDLLITAAREAVEINLNRKLLTQTLRYTLDIFPAYGIQLPGGAVQSITTFTYLDRNNVSQTVSSSLYNSQLNKEPAVLLLKPNETWPDEYEGGNAVVITYVAGWSSVDAVPKGIRIAIKEWVLHHYRNREAYSMSDAAQQLNAYERILFPYRVYGA
jgi:uncharacterized phiE125 gp8 family phage protein